MSDTKAELPKSLKEGLLKEFDKHEKRLWEKMPSARFPYWSKRDLWTLKDFAYLLKGKEPLEKDDDRVVAVPESFVTYFTEMASHVSDAILLDVMQPIFPHPDAEIFYCRLPPREWLVWAKRKELTIPDEFLHLLDSNEPETGVVENKLSPSIQPSILPGDLSVVVNDVNQAVTFVSQQGDVAKTKYKRKDIVGKGTVTWDLLVAFAKCKGSLEGNTRADVKKINTSVNRKNLAGKLMAAMNLDKSPIVEGRNGVMSFRSIQLAGGAADAMDRKTCSLDNQGSEYLRDHGEDIPVID